MSVENVKKFGQLIAADASVREEAKAIGKTNVEGLMIYAAERGLPFEIEDLQAVALESGFKEDELNEEQLKLVAGGAATVTVCAALIGLGAIGGGTATAALLTVEDW